MRKLTKDVIERRKQFQTEWLFVGNSCAVTHAVRKDKIGALGVAACGKAGQVRETYICLEAHEIRHCKNCERKLVF